MNTYIRNMIIILSMIGGYSILFVENTFAQRIWSPQRQSEEPVSIDAYKSVDEDFYLQLKVEYTNEEEISITNIDFLLKIFPTEGFLPELMYTLTISSKGNCPAGESRTMKMTISPNKFSSLSSYPISDEYEGYIQVSKIRYSNGKVWTNRDPKNHILEWM